MTVFQLVYLSLLIKLDVSTKWWRSVSQYPWLAVNKRMRFGAASSAAPFQSAVVYLGEDLDRFNDVFGKYGTLYVPHRNLSHDMQTNLSKLL